MNSERAPPLHLPIQLLAIGLRPISILLVLSLIIQYYFLILTYKCAILMIFGFSLGIIQFRLCVLFFICTIIANRETNSIATVNAMAVTLSFIGFVRFIRSHFSRCSLN